MKVKPKGGNNVAELNPRVNRETLDFDAFILSYSARYERHYLM
jgi:hypothetical protein